MLLPDLKNSPIYQTGSTVEKRVNTDQPLIVSGIDEQGLHPRALMLLYCITAPISLFIRSVC